jgi:hypothetical protein
MNRDRMMRDDRSLIHIAANRGSGTSDPASTASALGSRWRSGSRRSGSGRLRLSRSLSLSGLALGLLSQEKG